MTKRVRERIGRVILTLALLGNCGLAIAKLIPITLAELVQKSSFVAYGTTVAGELGTSPKASSTVLFEPQSVLKGESLAKGKRIELCNDVNDADSYNLSEIGGPYVVFAKEADHCYMPVRGMFSIVPVNNGVASTERILDQPEAQPLRVFLIRLC